MQMSKKDARKNRLMPGGIPRYVRCYDSGNSGERYTVVFSGHYAGRDGCDYLGMSAYPFHPQGVGQHGWAPNVIDAPNGWPPAMGRKCHLGRRISFSELPADCRKVVLGDYREMWGLDK